MTFARHNIEKRKLIELVRLNPILWDCRLPHYKRSDKKKAMKWNELGRLFAVNGERVQRTFTSLREIFRRELNHEKLLGSRFKSKWEYYDAMAFLKEVIRERKSRERIKPCSSEPTPQNNNSIDEYQYFAPNDPNNPNNVPAHLSAVTANSTTLEQQAAATLQSLQQSSTATLEAPNNKNSNSTLIQPDVIMGLNSSSLNALQKLAGHANGQQDLAAQPNTTSQNPQNTIHTELLSSTHSRASSSPSIYIKDEPDSQDDSLSLSLHDKLYCKPKRKNRHIKITHNNEKSMPQATGYKQRQRLSSVTASLVIDEDADMLDDFDDDLNDIGLDDCDGLSTASTLLALTEKQARNAKKDQISAKEMLYNKFGDFLAARLNTLPEQNAHELINKILLLIASSFNP